MVSLPPPGLQAGPPLGSPPDWDNPVPRRLLSSSGALIGSWDPSEKTQIEFPRTPAFFHRPSLQPEREAIDHQSSKCLDWSEDTLYTPPEPEGWPQQGPLPKPNSWLPRRSQLQAVTLPHAIRGSFGPDTALQVKAVPEARLHQQACSPWGPPRRRPADAAALRATTLPGSFKLLLCFTGDNPSQILCPPPCTPSLLRMLRFCPWRKRSKSVQQGSNGGLVLGAWLSLLPVTLAGGIPSVVQTDSGYAKKGVLGPLRISLIRPPSFPFHPWFASKRSGT